MLRIRKFKESDIKFVLNNWVEKNKLEGFFKDKSEKDLRMSFKKYEEEKSGDKFLFSYCIDLDGRPIGIIQFTEKYENIPNLNLYIEDVYQNQGYGCQAFELAKKLLKEKGYNLITSSCTQENIPSIKMHKKLGFNLIKSEKSPNGTPMHRWEKKI